MTTNNGHGQAPPSESELAGEVEPPGDDPLTEAALAVNGQLTRALARSTRFNLGVGVLAAAGAAWLSIPAGASVGQAAECASLPFAVVLVIAVSVGSLAARAAVRRLAPRWTAQQAQRFGVDEGAVGEMIVPLGPAEGITMARTSAGRWLLAAASVFALAVLVLLTTGGSAVGVGLFALAGAALNTYFYWWLGWRPPR